jgi:hypothetical protein
MVTWICPANFSLNESTTQFISPQVAGALFRSKNVSSTTSDSGGAASPAVGSAVAASGGATSSVVSGGDSGGDVAAGAQEEINKLAMSSKQDMKSNLLLNIVIPPQVDKRN